jgi:hypothetical protein
MSMIKPITLHYSEDLMRRAITAFWWRTTGWNFFAALAFGFALLTYLLISGNRSWEVGVFGSVMGFALILAVVIFFTHYRGLLERLRRMRKPEAILEPGEINVRISSDLGTSEFPWNTITEVWRFPDFWLLFFSRGQFITLPIADLDGKAQEIILSRLKSHGTKLA